MPATTEKCRRCRRQAELATTWPSVTLSAGSYLVWVSIDYALADATLSTTVASLSLVPNALSAQSGANVFAAGANVGRLGPEPIAQALQNLVTATGTEGQAVGPTVLTVPPPNTSATPNPTATLYLVTQAKFSKACRAMDNQNIPGWFVILVFVVADRGPTLAWRRRGWRCGNDA
jgi:hypothetical protein